MSLKILVLPTFIIIELIVVILYVKPNADAILEQRAQIDSESEALAKVDAVRENVQSIAQSLKSRTDTVRFVQAYYPEVLDEERVIDLFNYLAQQSGVIVAKVAIQQKAVAAPEGSSYQDFLNAGLTPEQATIQEEAAQAAIPKSYTGRVSVVGEYANIKDFFSRVRHADRIQRVREYSVEAKASEKKNEEDAPAQPSTVLAGELEVEFPYVKKQRAQSVLNDPLFQTNTFDFAPADRVVNYVTSPLPKLEPGAAGRTNPFE